MAAYDIILLPLASLANIRKNDAERLQSMLFNYYTMCSLEEVFGKPMEMSFFTIGHSATGDAYEYAKTYDCYKHLIKVLRTQQNQINAKTNFVITSSSTKEEIKKASVCASIFQHHMKKVFSVDKEVMIFLSDVDGYIPNLNKHKIIFVYRNYLLKSKPSSDELMTLLKTCVKERSDEEEVRARILEYDVPESKLSHNCEWSYSCHHPYKTSQLPTNSFQVKWKFNDENIVIIYEDGKVANTLDIRVAIRQNAAKRSVFSPRSGFIDCDIIRCVSRMSPGMAKVLLWSVFSERYNKAKTLIDTCAKYYPEGVFNIPELLDCDELISHNISGRVVIPVYGKISRISHFVPNMLVELIPVFDTFKLLTGFDFKEFYLYGGAILSTMAGTEIADYDIALDTKLTKEEVFTLINTLLRKHNTKISIDDEDYPKKILIMYEKFIFDVNLQPIIQASNVFPNDIRLSYDGKQVLCTTDIEGCRILNKPIIHLDSIGVVKRAPKYIRKGFQVVPDISSLIETDVSERSALDVILVDKEEEKKEKEIKVVTGWSRRQIS